MMTFQILSDLHLENPRAGYRGRNDDSLFSFLETQLYKFELVFFLLGNHEPYGSSWSTAKARVEDFSENISRRRAQNQALGKFVFLDQTRYDISDDVTVLGCTLYTRVPQPQADTISYRLNDFYDIECWTVEKHCEAHEADRKWLNDQVLKIADSKPHQRIIIFTHHSPTVDPKATDPTHANSPISSGFSTDLGGDPCWEKPQVRLWAFGHTHYNCDYMEQRTGKRVVANQRGYYFSQAKGFDPKKVVVI